MPTLWIYSQNDLFFGPALAQRFLSAFTRAGGMAEFVTAPANGKDGHHLFRAAIPLWTPVVDGFLARTGLTARVVAIAPPAPPAELSAANRAKFGAYLDAAGHKAFAVAPDGAFGWKSGQRSADLARDGAIDNCASHTRQTCRVVIQDDRVLPR